MPNTYHDAPDVWRVAQPLITAHHDHLLTNGVYVKFLFCEESEKVKGKEVLGTARKKSGLDAYLALLHDPDAPRAGEGFGNGEATPGKLLVTEFFLILLVTEFFLILLVTEFFLITINRHFWRTRSTTDHQRRALVDHELTHLWADPFVERGTSGQGRPAHRQDPVVPAGT